MSVRGANEDLQEYDEYVWYSLTLVWNNFSVLDSAHPLGMNDIFILMQLMAKNV